MVGLGRTMMTADSSQLTAYGPDGNEMRIAKDLPKAKTPHEQESYRRQIVATDKAIGARRLARKHKEVLQWQRR
jgi:hypothetical protein